MCIFVIEDDRPKAVFSRTLVEASWGPAQIFGGDRSEVVADLKSRDDPGTILVHGGPTFAKALARFGLVDEFRLNDPDGDRCRRSPFRRSRGTLGSSRWSTSNASAAERSRRSWTA